MPPWPSPIPLLVLAPVFVRCGCVIRSTPSTPSNAVSDATKLRLYGLYKRVTVGRLKPHGDTDRTEGDDYDGGGTTRTRPSMWNVVERYKYDAWASCDGMEAEEAAMEYVRVAAEEENDVGRACAALLEDFGNAAADGGGGGGRKTKKSTRNSTPTTTTMTS